MILGDIAPSSAAAHEDLAVNAVLVGPLSRPCSASAADSVRRRSDRSSRRGCSWPTRFIAVIALLVLLGERRMGGARRPCLPRRVPDRRGARRYARPPQGRAQTPSATSSPASRRSSSSRWACRRTSWRTSMRSSWRSSWRLSPASAARGYSSARRLPDADRWGSLGDQVRPQRPRRDQHHPRRRRPGGRADRCAIFVAIVFMATVTSLMAGPMMSRLLGGSGVQGSGQPRGSG